MSILLQVFVFLSIYYAYICLLSKPSYTLSSILIEILALFVFYIFFDFYNYQSNVIYALIGLCMSLIVIYIMSGSVLRNAIYVANKLHVSTTVIGMTVVAMSTSLPEIMSSCILGYKGLYDVGAGNIFGSNMLNSLICYSLFYLMTKHCISNNKDINARWHIILIALTCLAVLTVSNLLSKWIFIIVSAIIVACAVYNGIVNVTTRMASCSNIVMTILSIIVSTVCIILTTKYFVKYSVFIGEYYSINDTLIGHMIIAFGTSLPEIGVSFVALIKGNIGFIVGDIIGSNIVNLLIAMPLFLSFSLAPIFSLSSMILAMKFLITGIIFFIVTYFYRTSSNLIGLSFIALYFIFLI